MGKFATYAKRGSAQAFGVMTAPGDAEWTLTSPVAAQARATLLTTVPAPAQQLGFRVITATGVATAATVGGGPTINIGATTGTTVQGQIAWFGGSTQQLSPWSNAKSVLVT